MRDSDPKGAPSGHVGEASRLAVRAIAGHDLPHAELPAVEVRSMGKADEVIAEAEKLLDQRRFPEAVDLLSPWLTEHPDDVRAWELLAAAHLELQDWPRAEAADTEDLPARRGTPGTRSGARTRGRTAESAGIMPRNGELALL